MKKLVYIAASLFGTLTLTMPASTALAAPISAHPGMLNGHHHRDLEPLSGTTVYTSSNWSGYAATGSNGSFSSVASTWVQPVLNCATIATAYSAYWVGLDGFSSPSVEQIGTEANCTGGRATYSAWYEMYPTNPYEINVNLGVHTGDTLAASVHYTPPTTTKTIVRGHTRTITTPASYTLALADVTTHRSFSTTISPRQTFARSSSEVITEAPYSNGILPLADYGTVSYTDSLANGSPLGVSVNLQSITMQNPAGMLSTPSPFDSTNTAFSTTWSE